MVPGSTGTGFLVSRSDRLILTARHCIVVINGDERTIADSASLVFTDPMSDRGREVTHSTKAQRIAHGGDADWALLQAESLPSWTTRELRLLDTDACADHAWSTFGFPDDGGEALVRGEDFAGTIRRGGSTLPSLLDANARGRAIAGLSGGPAVVEEHVVGIIIRADQTPEGHAETGRLYMLPISACTGLADRNVTIHHEPPFLEATAGAIAEAKTPYDAARTLCSDVPLERIECVSQLPRHLAQHVLPERLRLVMRLVAEAKLPPAAANDVVEYAACQWYPPSSTRDAAKRLLGPAPKVVIVQCAGPECATRFIRRAGFDESASQTWDEGRIDPGWLDYEPTAALVDRVENELASRLDVETKQVSDALAKHMAEPSPGRYPELYWTVLPQDAKDEQIEAVSGRFPDLGIIVLGAPRSVANALQVSLSGDDAQREREGLERLRKDLKQHYERKKQ